MSTRRASAGGLISRRRAERRARSQRFAQLRLECLSQRVHKRAPRDPSALRTPNGTWVTDGELVASCGGRWDRRLRRYVSEGEQCSSVSLFDRQVEVADWFFDWLADHIAGTPIPDEDRIFSVLLHGGQRSGKTFVGVSLPPIAYTLAIPGSYAWIVCPTANDFEEVEDALEDVMPQAWFEKRVKKTVIQYRLANGSRIVLRSAKVPESLKKGRCDLIVMNECQQMSAKAYAICRGRVAGKGGLVIGCANPPDKEIGAWVMDWAIEAKRGQRQSLEFYFSPFDNPHVMHASFRALKTEIDEKSYAIEVLGHMLSIGDTVLYNWNRLINEGTLTEIAERLGTDSLRDITHEFTMAREGQPFARLVGVDPQRLPMASVEIRIFENPLAPVDECMARNSDAWWQHAIVVITDEVVVQGQEEDLIAGWQSKGWSGDDTLLIVDASSKYQFAERNPQKVAERRRATGGRGSWDVFKLGGYTNIRRPDKKSKANPDVVERCRISTGKIKTAEPGPYGQHFMFALPDVAETLKAIRTWANNPRGLPSRGTSQSHLGDALTYVPCRYWPRIAKRKRRKLKHRSVAIDRKRARDLRAI